MNIDPWSIFDDAENRSAGSRWWSEIPAAAVAAPVPGIAQQVYPECYGVFLYYARFDAGKPARPGDRLILRFEAVDYYAEVRLNGHLLGAHQGAETPFEFDATGLLPGGGGALLALRVITPEGRENPRIGELNFMELPLRHRSVPFHPGLTLNTSGIPGEIAWEWRPAVRIADCFVHADCQSGTIAAEVTLWNAAEEAAEVEVEVVSSLVRDGSGLLAAREALRLEPGRRTVKFFLIHEDFRLWELDDPQLYSVQIRLGSGGLLDWRTVRTGFRDFRVEKGFFHLNGRRIFLRSAHTVNHYPAGWSVPVQKDFLRRDLILAKSSGFNMVRFIAGMPFTEQLDLCDEIGLMVYEENLAAWWFSKNPPMPAAGERFLEALRQMILRDRNHPSITVWGLLNENISPGIFQTAVASLPLIRELDPQRLVLLSSGRWDCDPSIGSAANPGSAEWNHVWGIEAPGAVGAIDGRDLNPNGGAYFSRVGDVHMYLEVPHTENEKRRLRTLGGERPVFLSEYGVGSQFNVVSAARNFEAAGVDPGLTDFALCLAQEASLRRDWRRWNLAGLYPNVEEFLTDSARRSVRERRRGFDYVRGNPWLCGWNITGLLDHGMTGEGFWTFFRHWKPEHADVLDGGWAPLRWCLDVAPFHAFAGSEVEVEAILANEDVLPPGQYRAVLRITGGGNEWWSKEVAFELPAAGPMGLPPLAVPVFRETVGMRWPEGKYCFSAELLHGGDARDASVDFYLSRAEPRRKPEAAVPFFKIGRFAGMEPEAPALAERPENGPPAVIAVGAIPEREFDAAAWAKLLSGVENGDVAVFFDAAIFQGHRPLLNGVEYRSLDEEGKEKLPSMAFYPGRVEAGKMDAEFWGAMHFRVSGLPAGEYRVECEFAELCYQQAGGRVFSLWINGETALEDFDVFVETGYRKRIRRDFTARVDESGVLEIRTTKQGTLSELCIFDPAERLIVRDMPEFYRGCRRFPLPGAEDGDLYRFHDTLYHKDCVMRPHPVFAGLPASGIAEHDFYGDLPGHTVWSAGVTPDETMAAGIAAGYFIAGGYKAGVMLGAFRLGKGWFYLNTMQFSEANPAAGKLFANLLDDAARRL